MDFLETKTESGQDLIKAFSEHWLGVFPKPRYLLKDAAKSFVSEGVHEFLNIIPHFVAEKEAWAHGTREAAVQDVKHTASAIALDAKDLDSTTVLYLSVSALNSTEYTAGFSSFQWAFGSSYRITDEDVITHNTAKPSTDFARLATARQQAEEVARVSRFSSNLDDERRHVVWVLIGAQLYRCSVHSARPVTAEERFIYETSSEERPSQSRTLADILPRREYHDLTDQAPQRQLLKKSNSFTTRTSR